MARKSANSLDEVSSELMEFMSVFSRFLLDAGITNAAFASIVRVAFFKAATESAVSASARFANLRLNQSAIAAMTGLTRAEVRALSKAELAPRRKQGPIQRLVEGWITDPAFQTTNYAPRRLSIKAKRAGFQALVKKYGGDVPARSVLRELQRNGQVSVRSDYVQLERRRTASRGEVRLQQLSRLLTSLITDFKSGAEPASAFRSFQHGIDYPAASAKGRIIMQKRLATSLKALLADVRAAGVASSLEAPMARAQKSKVTRTRVVLVTEDSGN